VMARLCGWQPDAFWSATPAEVAAVLAAYGAGADDEGAGDGSAGVAGVGRSQLAAMMEAYPDG
jgi:uncharacterized phage protein (TIGR02216 family)